MPLVILTKSKDRKILFKKKFVKKEYVKEILKPQESLKTP